MSYFLGLHVAARSFSCPRLNPQRYSTSSSDGSYFFILPAMLQLVVEQARKIFHRKSPYAELLRGPGTGAPAPEIGSLQLSINAGGGNCVLFLICLLPLVLVRPCPHRLVNA